MNEKEFERLANILHEEGLPGIHNEIKTIKRVCFFVVLAIILVCGWLLFLRDMKCREMIQKEKTKGGLALASFCGKVSRENKNYEPIVINHPKKYSK